VQAKYIHRFFSRVDKVLRRSLGVSETAATDSSVKAAPPVDPEMPKEVDPNKPGIQLPDHMKDQVSVRANVVCSVLNVQ
jgi:heat shock protein 90kDa beta